MLDRSQKEEAIAKAAYALLEEKGYTGTSMLAIARKARASNETLYNWYGDKLGLFRALVTRNTSAIKDALKEATHPGHSTEDALAHLGPRLLEILLSPRAIALNRAAAADATGTLASALASAGREAVLPLIATLLEDGRIKGEIAFEDTDATVDLYTSLLIGDLQIKCASGTLAPPTPQFCAERSARALAHFRRLTSPATPSNPLTDKT